MQQNNGYLKRSWIDPRIEVRALTVAGKGLFADSPIKRGDIVEIFGGELFSMQNVENEIHCLYTRIAVDEGVYIGLPKDTEDITIDEYTNHLYDPSCWLIDAVTLVARRDIKINEEITMD